jgi:hypothetical protein
MKSIIQKFVIAGCAVLTAAAQIDSGLCIKERVTVAMKFFSHV